MIYLYDASAMICSGTLSTQKLRYGKGTRGDLNYYSFPTAGIFKLMGYIASDLNNKKPNDKIVVAFDCRLKDNIRRYYYPDYKENRIKNKDINDKFGGHIPLDATLKDITNALLEIKPYSEKDLDGRLRDIVKNKAIDLQKTVSKWMLNQMDINVVEHPNLEADDLIYSVCQKYGESEPVLLRADDGDLHDCKYFAKELTMMSVSGRGKINVMPGRMFSKILYGDLKDNVFALTDNISKDKIKGLANSISMRIQDVNVLGDYDKLSYMGFTPEESYFIAKNHFLKMPKIVDVNIETTQLNKEMTEKMFSIFGFLSLLKRIKGKRYTEMDMKDIHTNIYSAVPTYVREWYDLVKFMEDNEKANKHMSQIITDNNDDTVRELDRLLDML